MLEDRKIRTQKTFGKQESADHLIVKKKEILNQIVTDAKNGEEEYKKNRVNYKSSCFRFVKVRI